MSALQGRRPNSEHVTATHSNGPLWARTNPKLTAGDRNSLQRQQKRTGTAFKEQRQHSRRKAGSLRPVCQMPRRQRPQGKFRRGKRMGTAFQQQRQHSLHKADLLRPVCQMPQKATSTRRVSKRETHGHSVSTTTPTFIAESLRRVCPMAPDRTSTCKASSRRNGNAWGQLG